MDYVPPCGPDDVLRLFAMSLGDLFKISTVRHGPGEFLLYDISIEQHDSHTVDVIRAFFYDMRFLGWCCNGLAHLIPWNGHRTNNGEPCAHLQWLKN